MARLEAVGEVPDYVQQPQQPAEQSTAEKAATKMLIMGLSALSQRATIALAIILEGAFILALVASVFFLFYLIIPTPNQTQLVGVGMYGLFIISIVMVRRRK